MNIKKLQVNFIIKTFLIENERKTPIGYQFFDDKIDLRLFYFYVTNFLFSYATLHSSALLDGKSYLKYFPAFGLNTD